MIEDCIEEDFRFATKEQVRSYSPNERIWKPHMSGFQLSHLLDAIATYMQKSDSSGRVFVQGPGGTVLWVVKHLQQYSKFQFARAFVDPTYSDDKFLRTIGLFSNVSVTLSNVVTEAENNRDRLDCWVISSLPRLLWWEHLTCTDLLFAGSSLIVFDPRRDLKCLGQGGKYLMNTQVWVKT